MQPLGKSLPFRTINDVAVHFQDNKTCIEYLTQLRWNGKPKCAFCGHEHVYELKGEFPRYKCAKCRKQLNETCKNDKGEKVTDTQWHSLVM